MMSIQMTVQIVHHFFQRVNFSVLVLDYFSLGSDLVNILLELRFEIRDLLIPFLCPRLYFSNVGFYFPDVVGEGKEEIST